MSPPCKIKPMSSDGVFDLGPLSPRPDAGNGQRASSKEAERSQKTSPCGNNELTSGGRGVGMREDGIICGGPSTYAEEWVHVSGE
ncbi:hypothetical protein AOLI_G00244290 [Acnodon oligacanthus]